VMFCCYYVNGLFDEMLLNLLNFGFVLCIQELMFFLKKMLYRFRNRTSTSKMRPVFCGNLDYDVRISEIERLFGKYGRVERVDLKTG
jgi:hypothetical protein